MANNPLITPTLFGIRDVVAEAIERLRGYEALAGPDGYWLAYSGGKDSVVILELCKMAGVKFESHHSLTTIDPPELVQFVRDTPDVVIDRPGKSFFQYMLAKGIPPLRHARWCCRELKEKAGMGRLIVTGVRWAESIRRGKRRQFETCYKARATRFLHPIIDWTDSQVWEFIRTRNLPYCSLYDRGWDRIGCLFCPMAKSRERQRHLVEYPKYAEAFLKLFRRLHAIRHAREPEKVVRWKDGDEMFKWWIDDKTSAIEEGGLFE